MFPQVKKTEWEQKRVDEIRQLRIEVGKARADLTKCIAGGKLTKRQNQNQNVVVRLVGNIGTMRLRNFIEARSNLLKVKDGSGQRSKDTKVEEGDEL